MSRPPRLLLPVLVACAWALGVAAGPASADGTVIRSPQPGTPEYAARDAQNIADAYGRIIGPGGQLQTPAYLPALVRESTALTAQQLLTQAASPQRPAVSAGNVVPGWNVGNPLRAGWAGTRGRARPVAFTNRYGALLRGTVHAPLPHARDPYTGRRLRAPYPAVVLTPGSVQGSEGMYEWLAQDLAERGYVVLTYDVQGQGTSETFPHTSGQAFPFCNPASAPTDENVNGCPGVPFQQLSNFVVGTRDALSFLLSTADAPYPNPGAVSVTVDGFNPFAALVDHRPDPRPHTPGRTTRAAIIGHSLGGAAVSRVQATDKRVATVVALDKLNASGTTPKVPALAVQSEYGFSVAPYVLAGGSSLAPSPSPQGPDPMRERVTGFEQWRKAGVDTMLVVPRASTHLEYTDIPLVMPASRYGQALTSVYVQRWLDRYLKHRTDTSLLAERFTYLEPVGDGVWQRVTLRREKQLSYQFCSGYAFEHRGRMLQNGDVAEVGCPR